jgi:predicted lipid-binding transport protein (Tim44 family)
MKKTLALVALVLTIGMTAALDAQAKRIGAGKSAGMQRQNTTAPANSAGTGNAAAPTQVTPAAGTAAAAAGGATAAAGKRSWMAPLAGIAAGLGIAALASHFGMGEALANMLTIALMAMAVMLLVGMVLRKRAASQSPSLAGAGAARNMAAPQRPGSLIGSGLAGGLAAAADAHVASIPAGFDTAAFERTAREQFMALQAANDARDLDRLRDYLSPEILAAVRAEIAERGDAPQKTEVFGLHAQLLDIAEEPNRYIASVRFTGSVREQFGAATDDLNEVWHLVKPKAGMGGWVIAGIQQA